MQMYYEVSGAGDPLVILHGAYMNIPTMGDIVGRLAETHKVYALEFQGHGRTNDIDRPITYQNLADDVAAFMDAVGLEKAGVFGYSMGSAAGLQLAIRHPEKVDQLVAASVAYDILRLAARPSPPSSRRCRPICSPAARWKERWQKLAPNKDGFRAFAEKLIALEKEPMAWEADIKQLKTPVLIIAGDADVSTLEHNVALFRLLRRRRHGRHERPPPASRLAVLPATSHTAVINQTDLLYGFIEPFLQERDAEGLYGDVMVRAASIVPGLTPRGAIAALHLLPDGGGKLGSLLPSAARRGWSHSTASRSSPRGGEGTDARRWTEAAKPWLPLLLRTE